MTETPTVGDLAEKGKQIEEMSLHQVKDTWGRFKAFFLLTEVAQETNGFDYDDVQELLGGGRDNNGNIKPGMSAKAYRYELTRFFGRDWSLPQKFGNDPYGNSETLFAVMGLHEYSDFNAVYCRELVDGATPVDNVVSEYHKFLDSEDLTEEELVEECRKDLIKATQNMDNAVDVIRGRIREYEAWD